ncbi:Heme oxygenase [Duganella sp. CF517]|nr:Heme oxygenase [Duganella sp. CF517]
MLAALREATAQRHAELDAGTPLAAAEVDLRAYHDHLRLLEQWLAPIQDWIGRFDDAPRLPAYLDAIREDLAHAAMAGMADAPRGGPAAAWPAQCGPAWRWGVCYVVEGSQLGGAVLYKRLAEKLAPHPLGYLRGAGSPGPRWQQFIAALREHVVGARDIAEACEGARHAFDSLIALNRARSAAGPLSQAGQ